MVGIFTGLDKKPKRKEIISVWIIGVIFAFIIFIAVVGLDVDIGLIMLFWFIVIIPSGFIGYWLYG